MTPLPADQVQKTAQILLAFLDSDGAVVPGSLVEGVVSGKSLLRGLLQGTLVLCAPDAAPKPQPETPADPPKKKESKKKKATAT